MKSYETEVRSRWGNTDAFREHEHKTKNFTRDRADKIFEKYGR